MEWSRTRRVLLGAATLAVLTGCQGPSAAPGAFSSFQLGAWGSPPSPQPVAVAAQPQSPVVPPAAPAVAATAVPTAPPSEAPHFGGGWSAPAPAPAPPTGSLRVDLSGIAALIKPAAQRRILTTVADIDHLVITVKMAGLPDVVQTVTAAEMQAGTNSVTFNNLPTGTCTITIDAFDATGTQIGDANRFAPIAEAQPTSASLWVFVPPNDGTSPTLTNNYLQFGVDLQAAPAALAPDGSGPVSGTVLASYPIYARSGLYADNAGHFYVRRVTNVPQPQYSVYLDRYAASDGSLLKGYLMSVALWGPRIAPTGWAYDAVHGMLVTNTRLDPTMVLQGGDTTLKLLPQESLGSPISVDVAGDAYYAQMPSRMIQKVSQAGTTATTVSVYSTFDLDTAGNFWVNTADTASTPVVIHNEVRKYAQDGTLLGTYTLPWAPSRILNDGEGGVWVGQGYGGQIVHVAADGTVGMPLGVTATDFCLDVQHHLWVAGGPSLLKLAIDGTQLGSYPIKGWTLCSGDGYVFVGTDGYPSSVLKVQP